MTRAFLVVALLVATPAAADPPRRAAWISIPSTDGLAGAELGAEQQVAPRLAVAVELGARKSASGDYDGLTLNAGAELRWFFRGHGGWAPRTLDRAGWFTGARLDLAHTSLTMDDRALGSSWALGLAPELGYRIVPWRGLVITGIVSAEERVEFGDVPTWRQFTFGFGLEVGWMF